jgi:hypothetical protein
MSVLYVAVDSDTREVTYITERWTRQCEQIIHSDGDLYRIKPPKHEAKDDLFAMDLSLMSIQQDGTITFDESAPDSVVQSIEKENDQIMRRIVKDKERGRPPRTKQK